MKTPTKEQIEEIYNRRPGGAMIILTYLSDIVRHYLIKDIVLAWEEIKEQDIDKRVEEMCKENPGIKDFEDFGKR